MFKFLLAIMMVSNSALADCDIPTQIVKGTPSPCDGYVFSSATELKIRTELVYNRSLIDNLNKQQAIRDDMLKLSDEEIKKLKDAQPLSGWEKASYVGLGVLATSLSVWGASKLIR